MEAAAHSARRASQKAAWPGRGPPKSPVLLLGGAMETSFSLPFPASKPMVTSLTEHGCNLRQGTEAKNKQVDGVRANEGGGRTLAQPSR